MWVQHGKNPSWFKALPIGEQCFLLAVMVWDAERQTKKGTTSPSGMSAPVHTTSNGTRKETLTLQQIAALTKE